MSSRNERIHDRIFISRMVGVAFKYRKINIYPTRNISLSGMFIVGSFSHQPGSACDITLSERWADRQFLISLVGTVARHERDGIAIQYSEMGLDSFSLLQTLLLYESRNPTAMGEEFVQECPYPIRDFRGEKSKQRFSETIL